MWGDNCRKAAQQRAESAKQRAAQAVARKQRSTIHRSSFVHKNRLFRWQEDADVAGTGVQRTNEAHDKQRPEVREQSESTAGCSHKRRGAEQNVARTEPVSAKTDC